MNNAAAAAVARTMTSANLRRVMLAIETEMADQMARDVTATQAHLGQLELMRACGDELTARDNALSFHA